MNKNLQKNYSFQKQKNFTPEKISVLLNDHYTDLLKEFYEMQCSFLSTRYKVHKSIETSAIIISLIKSAHLAIIRQRERNLDHDISLNNFFSNITSLEKDSRISHKIVSIVKTTGIPKETVRRKIKKLIGTEFIGSNKNKEYFWNVTEKRQKNFINIMSNDIAAISKFICCITKYIGLDLTQKVVEEEIKAQFSFYFYHFTNCQLTWLKIWQDKFKDVDLIFIIMQVLIPTLNYADKSTKIKNLGIDNLYTIIGKTNPQYRSSENTISASSISEISGIPRATCIRKLQKLVRLGFLIREIKTKRYYVNQTTSDRTKHVVQKDFVLFTINSFSDFLAIVINAIIRNQRKF